MIPLSAYWSTFLQTSLALNTLWYGLMLLIYQYFPIGLVPGAVVTILAHFLRAPKPANSRLEKILGKDLHLVGEADTAENNNVLMRTVAHRGAGLDAPENSLIAFKQCATEGCMYIEFDVALTKDGVPVVFHDRTFERVANDKRNLRDLTFKELNSIDIAANHPFKERYEGTRIPTLDVTVKQLLADGQKMFIDIKESDYRMVPVINELYQTFPTLYDNAVVTTFFPNIIYAIRKQDPQIVCSLAYRPYFFSNESYSFLTGVGPRRYNSLWKHYLACIVDTVHSWALPRITCHFIGLSVILLHKDCVSPQIIKEWRDRGIRPCVWTINKPVDKHYIHRTLKCTYLTDTLIGENSMNMSDSKYN